MAIASLALAFGAAGAVFLVVDAVLVRPLPYSDPQRLVLVREVIPQALDEGVDNVAPANYVDLRGLTRVFSDVAARSDAAVTVTLGDQAQRLEGGTITANVFSVLGTRAEIGRTLQPEDQDPSSARVMVLSHRAWIARFGGDRTAVGRTLDLDGRPTTVVGVMPAAFRFPGHDDEFWVPFHWSAGDSQQRSNHFLTCVARLTPGIPIDQAEAAAVTLAHRLERDYPETNAQLTFTVSRLDNALTQPLRPALTALTGAVLVMFLIACVNVANLTLTRTIARRGELSLRAALGASPLRVASQLAIESLVIATIAAGVASLSFQWGASILLALLPAGVAPADATGLHWHVILFTAISAAVAAVISTAASTVVLLRRGRWDAVSETSTRVASGTPRERRVRQVLVACEVMLALVLLITSGLLLRSFANVVRAPSGFEPDHVLTAQLTMTGPRYASQAERLRFVRTSLTRLQAVPGVSSAAFITFLPLTTAGGSSWFTREGMPSPHPEQIIASNRLVTPGYFRTMGVPLKSGRLLEDRDREGQPLVALVNEAAAKRFWPGESAVGRRFRFGPADSEKPWIEVVGVVGDVRETSLEAAADPEIYRPVDQDDQAWLAPRGLVVQTAGSPTAAAADVRAALRAVDPAVPVISVQPYRAILERSTASRRVMTVAVAAFASVALALAIIGIAGIVAYAVACSEREIAVRLALGAERRSIVAWAMRRTAPAVIAGVLLGCMGAAAATRWVASLLFEVSPVDVLTFGLVAGVVLLAAWIAAYVPARRAGAVDPAALLRSDG